MVTSLKAAEKGLPGRCALGSYRGCLSCRWLEAQCKQALAAGSCLGLCVCSSAENGFSTGRNGKWSVPLAVSGWEQHPRLPRCWGVPTSPDMKQRLLWCWTLALVSSLELLWRLSKLVIVLDVSGFLHITKRAQKDVLRWWLGIGNSVEFQEEHCMCRSQVPTSYFYFKRIFFDSEKQLSFKYGLELTE